MPGFVQIKRNSLEMRMGKKKETKTTKDKLNLHQLSKVCPSTSLMF